MFVQTLKISIVTVCFNAEATLGRALDSVARQTYSNFEHILIDGGSTDRTMHFVSQSNGHFSQIVSEPDHGIYDAMNKGLALTTGDVVVFLNADDYYASNDILADVAKMFCDQKLDVLTGNVAYFNSGCEKRAVRIYDSSQFCMKKLAQGLMPAHPALFVRREILQRMGGFKADYKIAGDFELVARMFKDQNLRLAHLSKILVHMQLGGVSTSSWKARWLINKEILRACRENGIKTNIFRLWMRYPRKLAELKWF